MPLTPHGCRVASVGEQFRDCVLPRHQTALALTGHHYLVSSTTHRLAASHDCGAGRGALRLDVVVGEADAFTGELVDAWGRDASPVAREVTPADVVAQDEHDIWPSCRCRSCICHDPSLLLLLRARSDQFAIRFRQTFARKRYIEKIARASSSCPHMRRLPSEMTFPTVANLPAPRFLDYCQFGQEFAEIPDHS